MNNSPEPLLDLSEIVDLYKVDARRMVGEMRTMLSQWPDIVQGGSARQSLRRLAHQLRGSGRTYGFKDVSRISKAIENIILKMEKQQISANERLQCSLSKKVDRLTAVFQM